jgi:hypothetical protein
MEIIDEKEDINFNKWMDKGKDPCGILRWGCNYAQS